MDLTSFESDAEHRADDDDTAGGGDGDEGGGTMTPSMSDGSRSPKSPKPKIPAFFRSRRCAARTKTSEGIESDDTTDDSEEDVAGLYSPLRLSKTTASTATTEAADGGGWEDGDDGERMGGIPSARELFAASGDRGALRVAGLSFGGSSFVVVLQPGTSGNFRGRSRGEPGSRAGEDVPRARRSKRRRRDVPQRVFVLENAIGARGPQGRVGGPAGLRGAR